MWPGRVPGARPAHLFCNFDPLSASNTDGCRYPFALTDFAGHLYNQKVPPHGPGSTQTAVQSAHSLLGQIGNTPLIRLAKVDEDLPGVEIYAKAEFFNPGGSVKDRAGLNMILEGERSGALTKDHVLLDATSGNTGIAYAMICSIKGYRAKLVLPANASHERKQILKAYGAEMVFSDPAKAPTGRFASARKFSRRVQRNTFIPTSTATPPTGARISTAPAPKSSARPTAA